MYIVCRGTTTLALGDDGILRYADYATVFENYEAARHAVRRAQRHYARREYNWDRNFGSLFIVRAEWGA